LRGRVPGPGLRCWGRGFGRGHTRRSHGGGSTGPRTPEGTARNGTAKRTLDARARFAAGVERMLSSNGPWSRVVARPCGARGADRSEMSTSLPSVDSNVIKLGALCDAVVYARTLHREPGGRGARRARARELSRLTRQPISNDNEPAPRWPNRFDRDEDERCGCVCAPALRSLVF
jgi:hypothetical protein